MIYTAYYDASSKEEAVNAPLVVAGLGASEAEWVEFEPAWRAVLKEYDVEFLDMAKCAQWKGHPYEKWDESIRVPFLQALIRLLVQTVTRAAVVRIVPADFNAVNVVYDLGNSFLPSAYPIAAIKCTGLMEEMLDSSGDMERIAHIVERGDTGQGALAKLIDAMRLPITITCKQDKRTGEWVHPFGGCDMVAYEYRKVIQKKLDSGSPRIMFRETLRQLRAISTRVVYVSQANLIAMCEADPAKYPRR